MFRWSKALALASLLTLNACGYAQRAGDFTYACRRAFHPLDGPSCEHRLTEHYLLRYGEGSGDHVVLAFQFDAHSGSAGLIDDLGDDVVRRIGLDEHLLVVQSGDGRIFVAPAHPERLPEIIGPLTEAEFATRYPNAPRWREVQ